MSTNQQDASQGQGQSEASSIGLQTPVTRDEAFFEQAAPLNSFAGVDADGYVRDLRNKSRFFGCPVTKSDAKMCANGVVPISLED